MTKAAKLQIVGPTVVLLAVLAAELSAYALSRAPSSEFLWYVNLELLRGFQKSYYLLQQIPVPHAQLVLFALPLFAAACIGVLFERRLLLAAASNICMIYAAVVFFASFGLAGSTRQASLSTVILHPHPSRYLVLGLLGCAALSFVVSHWIYARSVYYET